MVSCVSQPVATRRPFDDPGLPRPWYRLVRDDETVLAKTHMPYVLSPQRMAKYRAWFLEPAYPVTALPSYDIEQSSNPFLTFAAIPPDSRYRFLLDEAEFFIMNFIKGPVCRGQMALDVIQDRFWVFFMDPKSGSGAADAELAARLHEGESLRHVIELEPVADHRVDCGGSDRARRRARAALWGAAGADRGQSIMLQESAPAASAEAALHSGHRRRA